jgi:LPS-assembly protein
VSRRRSRRAALGLACGVAMTFAVGGRMRLAAQDAPSGSSVAAPRPPEDEITIDAESLSYDKKTDTVSASGDVIIRRGESVLRADEVQLDRRTNEAQVLGDSVLTSPEVEIQAGSMYLDLDDETGELTDARIYSDQMGYTLTGDRIEKRIGQSYRIENGEFTTCNCPEGRAPDWSIAGESLDVALDGYGYLEGGRFEILDWPVLWVPRAALPVFRERQSGLLFPRVGFSNRRGFQLLQPYYWAIDKTQDATFSLDVETSLRIGVLGEYRYAFSQGSRGALEVGYFNESIRGRTTDVRVPDGIDPEAPENRWGIIGNHLQRLGTARGYVDLLLVSDNLFLREMNTFTSSERQEVELRTLPFTTSRVGVLQDWDRVFVQGQATYYQDLVGPIVEVGTPGPTPTPNPDGTPGPAPVLEQEESLTIQRVPDLALKAQKLFGFGVMGDFTSSVTNFQRGTGLTGVRGDFRPSAELRLPLGRSLFGAVNAAFRETAYGLTENRMSGGFTGVDPAAPEIDLPSGSSREIFELRGNLGTQVARVFDFPHFGLDKVKHTLEPMVEYLYIPPVDQTDLPVFDGIDRINRRSLFTYGLATRLLGRSVSAVEEARGEVFELLRLSAMQSYDILRDIPPTSAIDPVTGVASDPSRGDHFSDIDFALRVNPSAVTSVRAYATYDTSESDLSSATLGVRLRQPERVFGEEIRPRLLTRATFNVEYRFITNNILQLLDSSVALPLTDRIAALYAMRYDINVGSFLENYIGVRLLSSCDCWALNVGVIQTRNPNEIQVQAQFSLAGLGGAPGGLRQY